MKFEIDWPLAGLVAAGLLCAVLAYWLGAELLVGTAASAVAAGKRARDRPSRPDNPTDVSREDYERDPVDDEEDDAPTPSDDPDSLDGDYWSAQHERGAGD